MKAAINPSPEKRIRHADVSYDPRDMSHKAVFAFLIALASGGLIIHVAVFGLFQYLGKPQFAGHATTNPIMTSNEQLRAIGGDPAVAFPPPTLQPDPTADLNKFRAAEEEELNTYGWVDPSARRIHIPIESAIDDMSKSWPTQQEAARDEGTETPDSTQTGAQPASAQKGNQP
jgi:hypothetical protein